MTRSSKQASLGSILLIVEQQLLSVGIHLWKKATEVEMEYTK